jgi:peptidoglycan hydrolase-like protein with peptidoglycan-binding domain
MLNGRTRTLAVTGITIVGSALAALGTTTAASAATTAASAPAAAAAPQAVAAASGCVTEQFGIWDQNTYEVCVRDEQVLLNNIWSKGVVPGLRDLSVDGFYGSNTTADVTNFQTDFHEAGVSIDGITGPQTWWWVCHINSNLGFRGTYWQGAGCNTEGGSPPA